MRTHIRGEHDVPRFRIPASQGWPVVANQRRYRLTITTGFYRSLNGVQLSVKAGLDRDARIGLRPMSSRISSRIASAASRTLVRHGLGLRARVG